MLPLVWDEGELIDRAMKISTWLESPDLSRKSIHEHWKTTIFVEGHPAGYVIVIALGKKIAGFFPWLSPKTSWRFGSMLIMSIGIMFVARRLDKDYGRLSAVLAVMTIFCIPRVFAHAHFATCDAPLMAAWLLCWSLFPDFCETGSSKKKIIQTVIWGITLGLTISMKFTGWVAFLPFFLLGLLSFRRWAHLLLLGFFVAVITFFLLNPPLWHEPFSGFLKFFHLNTHREETFNISISFLGKRYNLDHSLPWYNTIFWTLITVPIPFLILSAFGVHHIFQHHHKKTTGLLLIFHWLILLVVRSLPGLPPHDGTRLIIAGFPFLGILAALGAAEFCRKGVVLFRWKTPLGTAKIRTVVLGSLMLGFVLVSFFNGARNMILFAPQWLSYYNGVIGGLPGAVRSGMEATYYWDALDEKVIIWLNENTEPGQKVKFAASSSKTLRLVRQWDGLKPEFTPDAPGEYQWYVIQRRPGAVKPWEVRLFKNAEPVYRRKVKSGTFCPFDVRETTVLYVFRYSDLVATQ